MRFRFAIASAALLILMLSAEAMVGQGPPLLDNAFPSLTAIPVISDLQYRASGAVRPLVLFWISRDNVGAARITRRRADDGTLGLEMLTGSDPARAPFGANRWGYIREIARGNVAEMLAVKTEVDEQSLEEAKKSANNKSASRLIVFIRERVTAREAVAWSAAADVGREVSFHDLEFVLSRLPAVKNWQERRLARPPDARPGFLAAFTELMDTTAKSRSATGQAKRDRVPEMLTYVHRAELFDLHQDQVEMVNDVADGTGERVRVLRARFWIWNRADKKTSAEWTMTYGMTGPRTGMPLRITYQPRWWLRTELNVEETPAVSAAER